MRVFEVMTKPVQVIAPHATAAEAAERMHRSRIRHLVVIDGAAVAGVLSDRDVAGKSEAALRQQSVLEIMSRPVITIGPSETVREAANLMRGHTIDCLPVVDRGRLTGILTTTDLLNLLGRGIDRANAGKRAPKHYRVPHRKHDGRHVAW